MRRRRAVMVRAERREERRERGGCRERWEKEQQERGARTRDEKRGRMRRRGLCETTVFSLGVRGRRERRRGGRMRRIQRRRGGRGE